MGKHKPRETRSIKDLPSIDPNAFPGVCIKVSTWATLIDSGWFDIRTKTIYLPKNASLSFVQHEYGHYLQSLSFSVKQYKAIEKASFLNALKNKMGFGAPHHSFWTERDANRRSGAFFGPTAPINWKLKGEYNWPR